MSNDIDSVVKNAIKEVLKLNDKILIEPETRLREDLGLDSMGSLELILNIEEKIVNMSIDPERLEPDDLKTYGSLCAFIKNEAQ